MRIIQENNFSRKDAKTQRRKEKLTYNRIKTSAPSAPLHEIN
jgi:hypothetical protein